MTNRQDPLTRLVGEDLRQALDIVAGLLPDELKGSLEGGSSQNLDQGAFSLRPFLVLLSSRRYGVRGERSARMAAAVHMIHYASVLHDRLGASIGAFRADDARDATHRLEAMDILLGDFLFAKASALIIDEGNKEVIEDMIQTSLASAETQARLLGLDREGDLKDLEEYFAVVSEKVSLFLALSCRVGPLIGGAPREEREILSRYGQFLGRAVRIAEDVRFWKGFPLGPGVPAPDPRYTYPVLLMRKAEGKAAWQELWNREGDASGQCARLKESLASRGHVERSTEIAVEYVAQACQHLDTLPFSEEIPVFKEAARRQVAVESGQGRREHEGNDPGCRER